MYNMSITDDDYDVKDNFEVCGKWLFWNKIDGAVVPFACRSARCDKEECRTAYWGKRLKLVAALIGEHELYKFVTLTWPRTLPMDLTWECAPYVWGLFRMRMNRRYRPFPFIAVLEEHEDGYPHVHMFTSQWVPQAVYSEQWAASGGGPITYVEAVKTGDVAEYVCKQLAQYIGKQQVTGAVSHLRPRARSMWRSNIRAKFELEVKPDKGWRLLQDYGIDKDGNLCYTTVQRGDEYRIARCRQVPPEQE